VIAVVKVYFSHSLAVSVLWFCHYHNSDSNGWIDSFC